MSAVISKMNLTAFFIVVLAYVAVGNSESFPAIKVIDGGISGRAITTRYWDCCKPSCSWREALKDHTAYPIASCAKDGTTVVDPGVMSACDKEKNGSAFMCTNQQPFIINSKLAYGFVAASFTGGVDLQLCCGCVLLSFEGALAGKQLLAQVTNAGSDLVVNQFDIAMPGGGVGLHNGCTDQWNAPPDGWGEKYGGVTSDAQCDELPPPLRSGCHFRWSFMEGIPNPNVTFVQVECPRELVALTGCELK